MLDVTWEDGVRTRSSGADLRWACPCAECRGEAGLPGKLATSTSLAGPELELDQVGLIGQYALQISFRSGHGTGIYPFPLLRQVGEGNVK